MRVLIAGDDSAVTGAIQELLIAGFPGASEILMAELDDAVDRAVQLQPGAVVVMLGSDPERALKVLREIQEVTATRLLVIGSGTDAQLILRALHEGAWQYVNEANVEAELCVAFRKLSLEAPAASRVGQLITVVGASGGSGVSTVATNLATCLSQKHGRCALLDLRLEAGDLATMLDLEPEHSLADFCRNANRMDQSMFERCFTQHRTGVWLMSPPAEPSQLSQVTVTGVRKALALSRTTFPYVVVDLDNRYRPEHTQALFQSDVIVLVMRLDFVSLRQARRVLDYLQSLRIDKRRVRLAVNRYGNTRGLRIGQIEGTLEIPVSYIIPDEPRVVNRANNKGVAVVMDKPRSKVARMFSQIAHSVNGRSPSGA